MNTATHTIQRQGFKARPQLVSQRAKRKGVIVKIQTAIGNFFEPNRKLDLETWKDLEFRNEREPWREPSVHLNRWI